MKIVEFKRISVLALIIVLKWEPVSPNGFVMKSEDGREKVELKLN